MNEILCLWFSMSGILFPFKIKEMYVFHTKLRESSNHLIFMIYVIFILNIYLFILSL